MSRALPHSIRSTLGFLIPLLGSDRDGEALGAARAIERKLRASGCDLHDLAAAVAGTAPAVVDIKPAPRAEPRPKSRRAEMWRPPEHVDLTAGERAELLARLGAAIEDPRIKGWHGHELRVLADRLERGELRPTRRMIERAEAIVVALRGETP